MRAILTFRLPAEQNEFELCSKGVDTRIVIDDICNEIRNALRYDSGELHKFRNEEGRDCIGCPETLWQVRKRILEMLGERNIPETY